MAAVAHPPVSPPGNGLTHASPPTLGTGTEVLPVDPSEVDTSPPITYARSEAPPTLDEASLAAKPNWRDKVKAANLKRSAAKSSLASTAQPTVQPTLQERMSALVKKHQAKTGTTDTLQNKWANTFDDAESRFQWETEKSRYASEMKPIATPSETRAAISNNDGAVQTSKVTWDNQNLFRGAGGGLRGGTIGTSGISRAEMDYRSRSELSKSEGGYADPGRQKCRVMAPGWLREQNAMSRIADQYLMETIGTPTVPIEQDALDRAWPLVATYGQGTDRPAGMDDTTFTELTRHRQFLNNRKIATSEKFFENRPTMRRFHSWDAANDEGYGTEFALEHMEATQSGETLILSRAERDALGSAIDTVSPSRYMTDKEKLRLYAEQALTWNKGPLASQLGGEGVVRLAGTHDDLQTMLKNSGLTHEFDQDDEEPFSREFYVGDPNNPQKVTVMTWDALAQSEDYAPLAKHLTVWDAEDAAEDETIAAGQGSLGDWCEALLEYKRNGVMVFKPTKDDVESHTKSIMSSAMKAQGKMPGCTEADTCSRVTCPTHGEYGRKVGTYTSGRRGAKHNWTVEQIEAMQDANPTTMDEDGTLHGFVAHKGMVGHDGTSLVATTRNDTGYVSLRPEKARRKDLHGTRTRGSTATATATTKTQAARSDSSSGMTDSMTSNQYNIPDTIRTGTRAGWSAKEREQMFSHAGLRSMASTPLTMAASTMPITA
jgi:hypothetical protein